MNELSQGELMGAAARPLRVRLTMPCMPRDCPLPIPGGGRVWKGCEFVVNPPEDDPCDYWIVMGFAHARERAWVAPENTLFICGEPPAKKLFPRGFYRQFHRVVDTHDYSRHPRLTLFQPCLGWGITWSYDRLSAFPRPAKINKVGVVCSSTAKTPGQRRRLSFLDALKRELGDDLVHFGRGFSPVADKMDAIAPYRFQLVLENSRSPHYCTEKLADAFLGWSHAFYAGCPNAEEYYPPGAFTPISVDDAKGVARLIREKLGEPPSAHEIAEVARARGLALNEYNPVARAARLAVEGYEERAKRWVEIRTYKSFRWLDRLFPVRDYS